MFLKVSFFYTDKIFAMEYYTCTRSTVPGRVSDMEYLMGQMGSHVQKSHRWQ